MIYHQAESGWILKKMFLEDVVRKVIFWLWPYYDLEESAPPPFFFFFIAHNIKFGF